LIGGWAVFISTGALKSKDIDIVVDYEELSKLKEKYETAKKDKELVEKSLEIEKHEAEAKHQSILRNSFIAGFTLVLLFALFVLRSYKQKQKANRIITMQKNEVEKQKHLIEEHQKEILDSIHYAKRIQRSLLPTDKYFERVLNKKDKTT